MSIKLLFELVFHKKDFDLSLIVKNYKHREPL